MHSSIKNAPLTATLSEELLGESETSKARLKLVFIGSLFLTSWIIGTARMGEVFVSNHSVSLLGTLIGM